MSPAHFIPELPGWRDIAEEFLSLKVQTGGRVLEPDELMRRREAERKMFLGEP